MGWGLRKMGLAASDGGGFGPAQRADDGLDRGGLAGLLGLAPPLFGDLEQGQTLLSHADAHGHLTNEGGAFEAMLDLIHLSCSGAARSHTDRALQEPRQKRTFQSGTGSSEREKLFFQHPQPVLTPPDRTAVEPEAGRPPQAGVKQRLAVGLGPIAPAFVGQGVCDLRLG